jgi:hypothetical protein
MVGDVGDMPLEENGMEKQRCRRRLAEMEAGMVDLALSARQTQIHPQVTSQRLCEKKQS